MTATAPVNAFMSTFDEFDGSFLDIEPLSFAHGNFAEPSVTLDTFDVVPVTPVQQPSFAAISAPRAGRRTAKSFRVPASPPKSSTRPCSPASSTTSNGDSGDVSNFSLPVSTAGLNEDEKERIRREKKREADRKCRKRKKERMFNMEERLKTLEDEKIELLNRLEALTKAANNNFKASPLAVVSPRTSSPGSSPCSPHSEGESPSPQPPAAAILATATASLDCFNKSMMEISEFVRSKCSGVMELATPTCDGSLSGRPEFVNFWIGMKQSFPNSTLTITSVSAETDSRFHLKWNISGMCANGRPLSLKGHCFVDLNSEGMVTKFVVIYNVASVISQQLGMELDEFNNKKDNCSFFEDFWL